MAGEIKITGLVGSKRKKGNSFLLVKQALKGAEKAGGKGEIVELDSFHIEPCKGCLSCVFKGKCPQEDDMFSFLRLLINSEGLILAAPTYLLSPAARLKALLDRFLLFSSFLGELESRRRYAVTFSVAGNKLWNPLGVEMVNQFVLAAGFTPLDYREAYAPGPGEVLLQRDLMNEAFNMGEKLVDAIRGRGESLKRGTEDRQCPVCYSKTFSLKGPLTVQCPFCLIEGKVVLGEEGVKKIVFKKEDIEDHFWAPRHRQRHLAEWVKKTREPYLARRQEIMSKMAEYEL